MPPSAAFEAKFKAAFGFTDQDWADNLAGRLSRQQALHWKAHYANQIAIYWGMTALFCVLAVVLPLLLRRESGTIPWVVSIPMLLLALVMAGLAWRNRFYYYRLQSHPPISIITAIQVDYQPQKSKESSPYRLCFSNYNLPLHDSQVGMLYSGHWYRIHLLPVQGHLLSLQPEPRSETEDEVTRQNIIFRQVLGRTVADFERGVTPSYPSARLTSAALTPWAELILLGDCFGPLALIVAVDAASQRAVLGILAAGAIGLALLVYRLSLISRDIAAQSVAHLEGQATVYSQAPIWGHFTITIAGQDFTVGPRLFFLFRHSQYYRIIYSPRTKVILAAELLPEPVTATSQNLPTG